MAPCAGRVRGCFPAPGVRPDLTGLSCRFEEIRRTRLVLSLLIVAAACNPAAFRAVIEDIVSVIARAGYVHPVRSPASVALRRLAPDLRRAPHAMLEYASRAAGASSHGRSSIILSCDTGFASAASCRRLIYSKWSRIPISVNSPMAYGWFSIARPTSPMRSRNASRPRHRRERCVTDCTSGCAVMTCFAPHHR